MLKSGKFTENRQLRGEPSSPPSVGRFDVTLQDSTDHQTGQVHYFQKNCSDLPSSPSPRPACFQCRYRLPKRNWTSTDFGWTMVPKNVLKCSTKWFMTMSQPVFTQNFSCRTWPQRRRCRVSLAKSEGVSARQTEGADTWTAWCLKETVRASQRISLYGGSVFEGLKIDKVDQVRSWYLRFEEIETVIWKLKMTGSSLVKNLRFLHLLAQLGWSRGQFLSWFGSNHEISV